MVKLLKSNSGWKKLEIGSSIFAGDATGCLAGVEELVDYSFVEDDNTNGQAKKTIKKKKNKKRRKQKSVFKVEDQPVAEVENDDEGNSDNNNQDEVEEVNEEVEEIEMIEDLFSWMNICVPKEIARSLIEQGFTDPTEIQRLCIPGAIEGRRDILGAAETGSGKTLAFGIPIIAGIMNDLKKQQITTEDEDKDEGEEYEGGSGSEFESDAEAETGCLKVQNLGFKPRTKLSDNRLYSLVIAPTRELAIQVNQHLTAAAKYTGVKVGVVIGGMSSEKQCRILNKKRPHIIVATPGRLWELINAGETHLADIHRIRYLAIDETDRMLEKDHFPELRQLLEKLDYAQQQEEETTEVEKNNKKRSKKERRRQNFVFSATLTFVHEPPEYLKRKGRKIKKMTSSQKLNEIMTLLGMTNPKVVDVTTKTGTANKLTESRITCAVEDKDIYLHYFLERHPGRTLVFLNSISAVRRLTSLLTILGGSKPLPLHAQMQQRQRLNNLDRFKSDPRGVLLATDVAARGLDIPRVEHVVHYHVPRTSENYIHRSGRTARADHEGLTLLLIDPSEVKNYTKICTSLEREEDLPEFPVEDGVYERARERVVTAREIDLLEMNLRKTTASAGWLEKAARDMDIILDEDQLPKRHDDEATAKQKRILKTKRNKLKALLSVALVRSPEDIMKEINQDDDKTSEEPPEKKVKLISKPRNAVEAAKSVRSSQKKPKFRILKIKKTST